MKKKFLSLALIAMSFVAFSSAAQTTADTGCTKTEKMCGKKADKKDKKGMRKQMNPFEGMTLTDAQKSQLEQLNAKRRSERQEMKQVAKAQKQRKDSTMMEARKASKKAYLEEVKAIVGPDQYVVFLENMYINNGGQKGGKAMMGKAHRDGKQKFAHNRGDRKGDGKQNRQDRRGEKTMKANS